MSKAKPRSSTKVRVYAAILSVIVVRLVLDLLRREPLHWAQALIAVVVIVASGSALFAELRKPQAEPTAD